MQKGSGYEKVISKNDSGCLADFIAVGEQL